MKKQDVRGVAEFFNESLIRGASAYTNRNVQTSARNIKEQERNFSAAKKYGFRFVAIDHGAKKVVGSCSFHFGLHGRTVHSGVAGWSVHPDYRRMGIATRLLRATIQEAKALGYERIEAEAAVGNSASVRLAEKCGFKIEGRKRKAMVLDNGKYEDVYVLGRLLR
jgi:RimJ/RimL family protein N-acetyltransferase